MGFVKKAVLEARTLPKVMWVAAVILPFGLVIAGTWIMGKGYYESRKKNRKI